MRQRLPQIATWLCYLFAILALAWAIYGCSSDGTVTKTGAVASAAGGSVVAALLAGPLGLVAAALSGFGAMVAGLWYSTVPPQGAPPDPWYVTALDTAVSFLWLAVLAAALIVAWRRGWLAAGFRWVKARVAPPPPQDPEPPTPKEPMP